jgi:hypothetical protein
MCKSDDMATDADQSKMVLDTYEMIRSAIWRATLGLG